jgi:hypothetical protein
MRATGPKKPIASGATDIHDPVPAIIMTADAICRAPDETASDRNRIPSVATERPDHVQNCDKENRMTAEPKTMQARLVQGWEIREADVGIGLIFKLARADGDGMVEIVGDVPLLLSPAHCRSLAAHLIEIADRAEGPASRA